MLRRYIGLLFLMAFTVKVQATSVAEHSQQNPYLLTQDIVELLEKELKQLPADDSKNLKLRNVVENVLAPYIDDKYVSLYVLGKHLKKLNKSQVLEFNSAFKSHLISTYISALSHFDNQSIQVEKHQEVEPDKGKVAVKIKVSKPGTMTINLVFKLRKNKRTKLWRIYDFVAEGISMLHTKRSEFSEIIRRKGFESTVQQLKASN